MSTGNNQKRRPAINPPGIYTTADPIYQRECTYAVDASVESLIEMAVGAGWERQHVVAGILFAAARQLDDTAALECLASMAAERDAISDAVH